MLKSKKTEFQPCSCQHVYTQWNSIFPPCQVSLPPEPATGRLPSVELCVGGRLPGGPGRGSNHPRRKATGGAFAPWFHGTPGSISSSVPLPSSAPPSHVAPLRSHVAPLRQLQNVVPSGNDCYIAIEHGHRNSEFSHDSMVMFHSLVNVDQGGYTPWWYDYPRWSQMMLVQV